MYKREYQSLEYLLNSNPDLDLSKILETDIVNLTISIISKYTDRIKFTVQHLKLAISYDYVDLIK